MLRTIRLIPAFALCGFGLLALSLNIQTTGMAGIAAAQTARLSLLNPGVQAPGLGLACTAQVAFVDDSGAVLKSGTLTVDAGRSLSFDLSSDADLNLAAGDRRQIRAQITVSTIPPPATNAGAAGCTVVPTFEIFDTATGRTQVILTSTTTIPGLGL